MHRHIIAVFAATFLLGGEIIAFAITSQSLDGEWRIAPDFSDQGKAQSWFVPEKFPLATSEKTTVPGNIYDAITVSQWPDRNKKLAWYYLNFTPSLALEKGDHAYLRFGAVSRKSDVWLNGTSLGYHDGGENPFEYDVTKALVRGKPNTLVVRVYGDWLGGIVDHVTLVVQPAVRIVDIFARPDWKSGRVGVEINVENNTGAPAQADLAASCSEWKSAKGVTKGAASITAAPGASTQLITLSILHPHLWDLNDPFLYKVDTKLNWKSPDGARADDYTCRIGFRDFRNVGGYFYLNGKRIFVRSTHGGGHFDPLSMQATPSRMTYIGQVFPQLKKAGFNMMRFLQSTPLVEQLDQADEMGFLIYAEHETSWHDTDPNRLGITLPDMVRRDRNHPSLVMWGILNETEEMPIFEKAKGMLPALRAIDDTRYIELSSGRFEHEATTGSASNPGSSRWDVYLGGEDPTAPKETGNTPDELGAFRAKMGDIHPYPFYPLSWPFLMAVAHLSQDAKPIFVSETGMGSTYDGVNEKTKLDQAGAPKDGYAYMWARPAAVDLEQTWKKYDLSRVYPDVGSMMADSQLSSATQRATLFSALRGNPRLAGYSLTSIFDAGGAGEGVMDTFNAYKAGHLKMLQEGWAPLRWCLLVNPTHIYAGEPLRVFATLSSEDQLPPGDYPVTLTIKGMRAFAWTRKSTISIKADGPMAYPILDEDVTVPNLKDGTYRLTAELDNRPNGAASELPFQVTRRESLPNLNGSVTVLGLSDAARRFLTARKLTLHDYAPGESIDWEVIVVGDGFKGSAADWRTLYSRVARGAQVVFLANSVFAAPGDNLHWLALPNRGSLSTAPEWLYHRDYIAKPGHVWDGLQTKLMLPEFFGTMMNHVQFINDIAPGPDTAAMGIYCTMNMDGKFEYHDGLALGTFPFHAGHLTLNAFDILGTIGRPASDRLLVNMIKQAQARCGAVQALPSDFDAEIDRLNIK